MPEPAGLKTARVEPDVAHHHPTLDELLYEAVRTARSAEGAIGAFVASTYDAAATLGNWDRTAFDAPR